VLQRAPTVQHSNPQPGQVCQLPDLAEGKAVSDASTMAPHEVMLAKTLLVEPGLTCGAVLHRQAAVPVGAAQSRGGLTAPRLSREHFRQP
jgi:hypothetical protein